MKPKSQLHPNFLSQKKHKNEEPTIFSLMQLYFSSYFILIQLYDTKTFYYYTCCCISQKRAHPHTHVTLSSWLQDSKYIYIYIFILGLVGPYGLMAIQATHAGPLQQELTFFFFKFNLI